MNRRLGGGGAEEIFRGQESGVRRQVSGVRYQTSVTALGRTDTFQETGLLSLCNALLNAAGCNADSLGEFRNGHVRVLFQ